MFLPRRASGGGQALVYTEYYIRMFLDEKRCILRGGLIRVFILATPSVDWVWMDGCGHGCGRGYGS